MNIFRRILGQSTEDEKNSDSQDVVTAPASAVDDISETSTSQFVSNGKTQELVDRNIPDGATRPLDSESIVSVENSQLTFGQSSHQGMIRENNQDSSYVFLASSRTVENRPDFGLFVVADGMGGHHDGEKASSIAAQYLASDVLSSIYVPMLDADDSTDSERPTIVESLVSATQKANAVVHETVPDGGTTLTAVVLVGNLAYISHVGDSRAYLIRNSGVEQLTRDHSLVQRLIELGQLTPEEAEDHPQKNVLYRALGQNENLEVERLIRPMPPNSQILLCSDGLWGLMSNDDIKRIVDSSDSPQQACDKLVALANTNGGTDNITAVLIKIPGSK